MPPPAPDPDVASVSAPGHSTTADLVAGGDDRLRLRKFMPELDGLRFYAFLFVLVGHMVFAGFAPAWVGERSIESRSIQCHEPIWP